MEAVDQRLVRWTYVCSVIDAGVSASGLGSEVAQNDLMSMFSRNCIRSQAYIWLRPFEGSRHHGVAHAMRFQRSISPTYKKFHLALKMLHQLRYGNQ